MELQERIKHKTRTTGSFAFYESNEGFWKRISIKSIDSSSQALFYKICQTTKQILVTVQILTKIQHYEEKNCLNSCRKEISLFYLLQTNIHPWIMSHKQITLSPFRGVREYMSQYPPDSTWIGLVLTPLRCGTCCGTNRPGPLSRPWGPLFAFCAKRKRQ